MDRMDQAIADQEHIVAKKKVELAAIEANLNSLQKKRTLLLWGINMFNEVVSRGEVYRVTAIMHSTGKTKPWLKGNVRTGHGWGAVQHHLYGEWEKI